MKKKLSLGAISNILKAILVLPLPVIMIYTGNIPRALIWCCFVCGLCIFYVQTIKVDSYAVTIKWPLNIFRKPVIIPLTEINKVFIECISKSPSIKFEMKNGTEQTVTTSLFSYELRNLQRYLEEANITSEINSFYW